MRLVKDAKTYAEKIFHSNETFFCDMEPPNSNIKSIHWNKDVVVSTNDCTRSYQNDWLYWKLSKIQLLVQPFVLTSSGSANMEHFRKMTTITVSLYKHFYSVALIDNFSYSKWGNCHQSDNFPASMMHINNRDSHDIFYMHEENARCNDLTLYPSMAKQWGKDILLYIMLIHSTQAIIIPLKKKIVTQC